MAHDVTDRTAQLRRVLVDTVNTSKSRRMVPRRWLIGGVAAFAIAGAATGGTISAVALSGGTQASSSELATLSSLMVGADYATIGGAFLVDGDGATVIDLGERPEGAAAVVVAVGCAEDGTIEAAIDQTPALDLACGGAEAPDSLGARVDVNTDGKHTLTISAGGRFAAWASWVKVESQLSEAQTAAVADDAITAEEYQAGFDRYSDCMTQAGYPLTLVDRSGVVFEYSVTSEGFTSGANTTCYMSEFEKVDMGWQFANPPR